MTHPTEPPRYDAEGNSICRTCGGAHRTSDHPMDPDYAVIRPGEGLPAGFLPPEYDGRWIDIAQMPVRNGYPFERADRAREHGLSIGIAVAVPTDQFEVREDGAVAQVWELQV